MRNTFSCGRVANPIQVTSRITVSQDAFHIANFTANSTAWHSLEVCAVSKGLCSKFLWKKQESRTETGVRAVRRKREGRRKEGEDEEMH